MDKSHHVTFNNDVQQRMYARGAYTLLCVRMCACVRGVYVCMHTFRAENVKDIHVAASREFYVSKGRICDRE